MTDLLEVANLTAGIGGTPIIRDVNFSCPAGSMTAIVGVNGVGKSTLLRALAHLTSPLAGQVRIRPDIAGPLTPLGGLGARQRARLIAFVGQEELPPPEASAREVVGLGRLPYRGVFDTARTVDRQCVDDAMAMVGVDDLADTACGKLSGGQRRRVLLARGLAQTTPVIFLDEPTNHLDAHSALHLMRVLRQSGRTIVATIHDLDIAAAHFDQVILLAQGRQYAAGPTASTLTRDIVAETFAVTAFSHQPDGATYRHLIIDDLVDGHRHTDTDSG